MIKRSAILNDRDRTVGIYEHGVGIVFLDAASLQTFSILPGKMALTGEGPE
jgi:hypothetical protein